MRSTFDHRVVPPDVVDVLRVCQRHVLCRLGGGAALSGAHLGHRLSRDVDLVCRGADEVRSLVRELPRIGREAGAEITITRDAGTFVRASVTTRSSSLALDAIYEATPPIEEGPTLDGVAVVVNNALAEK